MKTALPENNLLYHALGNVFPSEAPALSNGSLLLNRGELARVVEALAREIDDHFAKDSRVLLATRDQFAFALFFLAAIRSHTVPLLADPESPQALAAMVTRWQATGGLGDSTITAEIGLPFLRNEIAHRIAGDPPKDVLKIPAVEPNDPAFWAFTSGTTAESCAVVHGHAGPRSAFIAFGLGTLGLRTEDVTIATAGLPFVYALGNALLFPLMAGATAIVPRDLLLPTVLQELTRAKATVLISGPWSIEAISRLVRRNDWLEAIRRLRLTLSAGEPLPAAMLRRWKRDNGEIIDNLGCTEMFNSFLSQEIGRSRPGRLGRAVAGFELRVEGHLPTPGLRGALTVWGPSHAVAISTGDGIPEQIAENQFFETGDRVEIDADGDFVYLGRVDDRFKVRGRFVHPLEIERLLLNVDGVREVLAEEARDSQDLASVGLRIVPDNPEATDETERNIRRFARESLPTHLRRLQITWVDALPRSGRGKLLRRAS